MKVEVAETEIYFKPVKITITLVSLEELRALRRCFGGLGGEVIKYAVVDSNYPGPKSDSTIAQRFCADLYDITKDILKR